MELGEQVKVTMNNGTMGFWETVTKEQWGKGTMDIWTVDK
jgi:hypothetical protein